MIEKPRYVYQGVHRFYSPIISAYCSADNNSSNWLSSSNSTLTIQAFSNGDSFTNSGLSSSSSFVSMIFQKQVHKVVLPYHIIQTLVIHLGCVFSNTNCYNISVNFTHSCSLEYFNSLGTVTKIPPNYSLMMPYRLHSFNYYS